MSSFVHCQDMQNWIKGFGVQQLIWLTLIWEPVLLEHPKTQEVPRTRFSSGSYSLWVRISTYTGKKKSSGLSDADAFPIQTYLSPHSVFKVVHFQISNFLCESAFSITWSPWLIPCPLSMYCSYLAIILKQPRAFKVYIKATSIWHIINVYRDSSKVCSVSW